MATNPPMAPSTSGLYSGIDDFLSRAWENWKRGLGPAAPSSRPAPSFWESFSNPGPAFAGVPGAPPPRAVPTPDNITRNVGGATKTDLNSLFKLPGTPDTVPTGPPEDTSHIRFARQGEELHDYNPERGIEAYANTAGAPEILGSPSNLEGTGVVGHPGGGAFSPSASFDSLGDRKYEFPSYWEGIQGASDTARARAEAARLEKVTADPMYEERERAKIWTEAQLGLATGIQDALNKKFEEEMKRAVAEINADATLSPEQKNKKIAEARDQIYSEIFGQKGEGMAGAFPRSYGTFAPGVSNTRPVTAAPAQGQLQFNRR